jgi:hypothetical protein
LESKLAAVFLAQVIVFSASPEFAVRGPNGELLAFVHCCQP